jgi:hypothetical protein
MIVSRIVKSAKDPTTGLPLPFKFSADDKNHPESARTRTALGTSKAA